MSICVYQPVPEPIDQDDQWGLAAYLYQDTDAPEPDWCESTDEPDYEYWRDGEVYGIVVAPIGSLNPLHEQIHAVWGFYGYDYAVSESAAMLREAYAADLHQ